MVTVSRNIFSSKIEVVLSKISLTLNKFLENKCTNIYSIKLVSLTPWDVLIVHLFGVVDVNTFFFQVQTHFRPAWGSNFNFLVKKYGLQLPVSFRHYENEREGGG